MERSETKNEVRSGIKSETKSKEQCSTFGIEQSKQKEEKMELEKKIRDAEKELERLIQSGAEFDENIEKYLPHLRETPEMRKAHKERMVFALRRAYGSRGF